jgi:hypothetical protein
MINKGERIERENVGRIERERIKTIKVISSEILK